jgi:hypothetical protein
MSTATPRKVTVARKIQNHNLSSHLTLLWYGTTVRLRVMSRTA